MTRHAICCALVALLISGGLHSQRMAVVYEPVEAPVYELLLELRNMGVMDFDPSISPLSRRRIALLLKAADDNADGISLTARQEKEVDFYLRDYGFELDGEDDQLIGYRNAKDSILAFSIQPFFQGSITDNGAETMMQRGTGLNAFAYLGDHLAIYARLNDKGTTHPVMAADYLYEGVGGNLKPNQEFLGRESFDYSELNGGITYAWEWGHVGLVKERIQWGMAQYGANILSGRNPSNVMIDLHLSPTKWLEFSYIHSWLVSEVLDSSRTYLIPGGQRQVFTNKNMAANMVSILPCRGLRIDLGNSIVYSDNGIEPIYLIPLFFFKSADHNNSGAGSNQLGQNAQLFFSGSLTRLRGLWLYGTLFVDEVNLGAVLDEEGHTNLFSLKGGARIDLAAFLDGVDVSLRGEYTRTNPWTYRHQIPSTTYASNEYLLGHYLGENSEEWVIGTEYKPLRGLRLGLEHRQAYKGDDHVYEIIQGNANVTGLDFLSPARWSRTQSTATIDYEVITGATIHFSYSKSSIGGQEGLVDPFLSGDRDLLMLGFTVGL